MKALATAFALSAAMIAGAQSSEGFVNVARHFAVKLGKPGSFVHLNHGKGGSLLSCIDADGSVVNVDTRSGEITAWNDFSPSATKRLTAGANPKISSVRMAREKVENWFDNVGWTLPPFEKFETQSEDSAVYEYNLRFSDRPYGYRVTCGNYANVVVNAVTGEVTAVSRLTGFRYAPPPARPISPEEAVTIFRDRVASYYGIEPFDIEFTGTTYGCEDTLETAELADPRRPKLFSQRIARLQHRLVGALPSKAGNPSEVVAFIDAENGMILHGGVSKGMSRAAPSLRTEPISDGKSQREKSTNLTKQVQKVPGTNSQTFWVLSGMFLVGGLWIYVRVGRAK